jgi:hypothetical protein
MNIDDIITEAEGWDLGHQLLMTKTFYSNGGIFKFKKSFDAKYNITNVNENSQQPNDINLSSQDLIKREYTNSGSSISNFKWAHENNFWGGRHITIPFAEVTNFINSMHGTMVSYIKSNIKFPSFVANYMSVLEYFEINWPELETIKEYMRSNKYKNRIMKIMLLDVLDGNYKFVLGEIRDLQYLGVTWPELDTIENSVKIQTKSATNVNENKLWTKPYVPTSRELLQAAFDNSGSVFSFKWSYMNSLWNGQRADIPYLDVADFIMSRKYSIVRLFHTITKTNNVSVDLILDLISSLEFFKIDWSEFVTFKNYIRSDEYKVKLLPLILKDVKNGNYLHANSDIRNIRKVGIKWPELDVIEKSIALNNPEHEATLDLIQGLDESNSTSELTNIQEVLNESYEDARDAELLAKSERIAEKLHNDLVEDLDGYSEVRHGRPHSL